MTKEVMPRQQLCQVKQPAGQAQAIVAVMDRRRAKPRKYSYDAVKVQRIWAVSGGPCGNTWPPPCPSGSMP
jgi:hypothetical protein